MANHEENEWEWKGEKFSVMPGEFVTSLESIRQKAGKGISIQNVRSAINRFKKLEFLTERSTKSGRVITICNWSSYQPKEKGIQQRKQQTANKDLTTNNNEIMKEDINTVLSYLNQKAQTKYKPTTKNTVRLINARFAEGYSVEDLNRVTDTKCQEWLGTDNEKYLRPETLFNASKFESYFNQKQKNGHPALKPLKPLSR